MTPSETAAIIARYDERIKVLEAEADDLRAHIAALAERVRQLENWKLYLVGAAAAFVLMWTVAGEYLSDLWDRIKE